ncbi:MAG: BrnT family toxin [Verrucomicrobiota bacterium]
MDFEWLDDVEFDEITNRDIEEAFEDPFSIRLLPEFADDSRDPRYFCLGKNLSNRAIFTVFWTNGKMFRVHASREMTEAELNFYERKNAEG